MNFVRNRLNHTAVPVVITAVLYFFFLLFSFNKYDPGIFPQAADYFANPEQVPSNLVVLPNSTGYDGQFYYRIALNPLTRDKEEFGINIGNPRYRHQRIIYPLLGWLFSFGEPLLVVYSLIFVNFLMLVVIGYLAGRYAQLATRHAIWGLALSLYPGFIYTLSRDLVEITEAGLLLVGLLLLEKKKDTLAATFLSLAILAKETALLAAVALISRKKQWRVAIMPIAVYGIWQLLMNWWWQYGLDSSTRVNIGLPIVGIIEGYQIGYEPERWKIAFGFLLLFFLFVLIGFQKSAAGQHIKTAWVFYAILLACLTENVWIESLAFLRAASLFYLIGTLILLKNRSPISVLSFLVSIAFWIWLAVDWFSR